MAEAEQVRLVGKGRKGRLSAGGGAKKQTEGQTGRQKENCQK